MNARVAFPFLTLSDIAIEASPWTIAQGNGAPEQIFDFLPDWDYATPLRLQRSVRIHSDLSPGRRGDRLWHDQTRVRLEGEEPRFPIEVADFQHLLGDSPAAHSPWYLHWSPQWTRDFHGSIRLYLNVDHRDLIARIESEDGDTLRFLMADVMGQVCECLVREDDPDSIIHNCDEGTLGAQAGHWLRQAFPGQGLSEARSILEKRPGVFRASFQAIAEVKGDDA